MRSQPLATFAGLAPGIHLLDLDELAAQAAERGFFFARVDLADCDDKACLLRRFAEALSFPEWFGHNWDAFADCLADLDWLAASGHVLVVDCGGRIAHDATGALDTCREILAETIVERSEHGLPMWVFWRDTNPG